MVPPEEGPAARARRWEPRAAAAAVPCAGAGPGAAAAEAPRAGARPCPRRVLFVGNSLTYQPKELGGLPGAVARVAAAAHQEELHCEALARGGADLLELWGDFEERLLRGGRGPGGVADAEGATECWDAVVLQVGRGGADAAARFATLEVLQHRYAPLLLERQPGCQVLLYQTWAEPDEAPELEPPREEGVEAYRAALLGAAVPEVRVVWAGRAFRLLREGGGAGAPADSCIYPALFKDDSGHPSALAGLLVAAIVVLVLGGGEHYKGPSRSLGQILAAILPPSWRTASASYTGQAELGQRGWLDGKRTLPVGLLDEPDEDLGPLGKYPPGLRTEKRALGPAACDALAAVAGLVAAAELGGAACAPGGVPQGQAGEAGAAAAAPAPAVAGAPRRWRTR